MNRRKYQLAWCQSTHPDIGAKGAARAQHAALDGALVANLHAWRDDAPRTHRRLGAQPMLCRGVDSKP